MSASHKLNIVHVVGQLDMGGMEKLLVEFARHADRERFRLHFLALGNCGVVAKEIEALGWPVDTMGLKAGLSPRLVVRLARVFRRMRPVVVHSHNTRALLYAGPAARLAGVQRMIHTRHGQGYGISRREMIAFRLATRMTDRVVCVSRDSASITRTAGVPPGRIRTLLNGIDVSRFRSTSQAVDGPALAVGRLSPEKDFATLIRAAAIAYGKDKTFRLEIAGDGVCMMELRKLIEELRLEGAVRLLGQVQDIPSLLSRASVFTLSSLTEGIPLTILEAMASGLPIVATRVGGNPEVVADGETGLLVAPGNAEVLASALLEVWRDPAKRRAMGAAGRVRVETHFDVRQMVAAYEKLYAEGQGFRSSGRLMNAAKCWVD